jgi:hypothetical protein
MKQSIILTLSLALAWMANANHFEKTTYTREFNKKFSVKSTAEFLLKAEFSNAKVVVGKSDMAEVKVVTKAEAKDESRANQVLDKIKINLTESESAPKMTIEAGGQKLKGTEKYTIDITISLPKSAVLRADMSFGNLDIDPRDGKVIVDIEYGNLKAVALNHSDNKIDVSFGNADIAHFGGGKAEVQYGNMDLAKATGTTRAEAQFGNMEIKWVEPGTNLDFNVEYGNAKVYLASAGGFNVKADVSFGDLYVPNAMNNSKQSKEMMNATARGELGSAPRTEIIGKGSFGNVTIGLKNKP